MIKTTLTILFSILCFITNAQKIQLPLTTDSLIQYEKVIQLDSGYKSQLLYKSVKTWFVNNFNSAKAVIQSEDQINGRFLGKCYINVKGGLIESGLVGDPCYFTVQIDVKPGKYRYRFYDFNSGNINVNKNYRDYLNDKINGNAIIGRERMHKKLYDIYANFDMQINSLINSLNLEIINSKKDDF